MKLTVVGTGYVGLVTGACLAEMGNAVLCVDLDQRKIEMLLCGEIPISEPGLKEIEQRNVEAQRLRFSSDVKEGARFGTIQFIAVGTPPDEDGAADMQHVLAAERIIVGADDERAVHLMQAHYGPILRTRDKFVRMDVRSAEPSKYAANAMLATRISFMNELALVAGKLSADIEQVRRSIGSDARIGHPFLHAGCGYGGSCFPKDVKALLHSAAAVGEPLQLPSAVERANERQKLVLVNKVIERFGKDLQGRHFALWGLAFKPDTDDLREATSLVIVAELLRRGVRVTAHDPVAMDEARRVLGKSTQLQFAPSPLDALEGADALLIVTEWKVFRSPDFERVGRLLCQRVVLDGRNLFDAQALADAGLEYFAIGRGRSSARLCWPELHETTRRCGGDRSQWGFSPRQTPRRQYRPISRAR